MSDKKPATPKVSRPTTPDQTGTSVEHQGKPEPILIPPDVPGEDDRLKSITRSAYEDGKAHGIAQERERVLAILRRRDGLGQVLSVSEIKRRVIGE